MKVLLVHNFYGSSAPSGENAVFEAEREMLLRRGVTVDVWTRHSDEIRGGRGEGGGRGLARKLYGLVKGAVSTVGNPFSARALARKIRAFQPDVVHFHNTFPLVSPLAVRAAHRCGAKVVMTLHNYRLVCAAGVPTRCGAVCTDCFRAGKASVWPAIRRRCYRGGLAATLPLALNIALYRRRWARWVDRFVALSAFQRQVMIDAGFPAEKIAVKGNFVEAEASPASPSVGRRGAVYVGRLSDEKGVKTLIEAWGGLSGDPLLKIIGDGDRRRDYERLARGRNIVFCGQQPHGVVLAELAAAKCLVMPSVCWETFGLTVVEAASAGTPSVVTDMGAFPDLVERLGAGEVVRAGDAAALRAALARQLARPDSAEASARLRDNAAKAFSRESNFEQLTAIYRAARLEEAR